LQRNLGIAVGSSRWGLMKSDPQRGIAAHLRWRTPCSNRRHILLLVVTEKRDGNSLSQKGGSDWCARRSAVMNSRV